MLCSAYVALAESFKLIYACIAFWDSSAKEAFIAGRILVETKRTIIVANSSRSRVGAAGLVIICQHISRLEFCRTIDPASNTGPADGAATISAAVTVVRP